MKRRKKNEADSRKDEILVKALEVFLEKGYEKMNMVDIAQKMNCSRGSLYEYFKSKQDICFYLYIDNLKNKLEFVDSVFNDSDSPELIIKNFLKKYYEFNKSHINYYIFEKIMENSDNNEVLLSKENFAKYTEITKEHFSIVISTLQKGIDQDIFRNDIHPRVMLAQLIFSGKGILERAILLPHQTFVINQGMINEEDFIDLYIDIIMKGIKKY